MPPIMETQALKTAARSVILLAAGILLGLLAWLAQNVISTANRPVTRQAIGESLLAQSRPLEAVIVFEEPAWQALANYRAGRYQRAAALYQQLDTVDSLYNYGVSLARLRRWNDAVGAFRLVLDRDKNHADARYNIELLQQIDQTEQTTARRNEGADQGGQLHEDQEATGEPNRGASPRAPDEQIIRDPASGNESVSGDSDDADPSGDAKTDQESAGGRREPMDKSSLPGASQTVSNESGDRSAQEPPADTDQFDTSSVKTSNREADITDQLLLRRLTDDAALVLEARLQAIARARQQTEPPGREQ